MWIPPQESIAYNFFIYGNTSITQQAQQYRWATATWAKAAA
jgi:hypothetical protein